MVKHHMETRGTTANTEITQIIKGQKVLKKSNGCNIYSQKHTTHINNSLVLLELRDDTGNCRRGVVLFRRLQMHSDLPCLSWCELVHEREEEISLLEPVQAGL
jgi:hypothetical protein